MEQCRRENLATEPARRYDASLAVIRRLTAVPFLAELAMTIPRGPAIAQCGPNG